MTIAQETREDLNTNHENERRSDRTSIPWRVPLLLLALLALVAAAYANTKSRPYVVRASHYVRDWTGWFGSSHGPKERSPEASEETQAMREGLVPISRPQEDQIGLVLYDVKPQTEPIKLDLNGTTAYDPDKLTTIRPRFNILVTKVNKTLGDRVSRGEALIELYSNDLATAKNDLQVKYVQWQHDRRLLMSRQELVKKGSISQVEFIQTQNDEAKSELDYYLAYDQLKVYGLTPEEIDPLLSGLTHESMTSLTQHKNISEKASMTLRSPSDGIVVKRDVVPGNLYEPSSVLMTIAPLEHLRVYANVYESDIDLVQGGQEMVIRFPFLERNIHSTVEVIANRVDPDTHAMQVRTTIKNPGARLKSDMLVRAELHIPPVPGFTVIPRNAMVATNGRYYVFVKTPAGPSTGPAPPNTELPKEHRKPPREAIDWFERREIRVAQENSDRLIVSSGLKPRETIVANGSLILAQIYEDMLTVATGNPL